MGTEISNFQHIYIYIYIYKVTSQVWLYKNNSEDNFHSFAVHLEIITSFIYPTECTTRLF